MSRLARRNSLGRNDVSLDRTLPRWDRILFETWRAVATRVVLASAAAVHELRRRELARACPPAAFLYRAVTNFADLGVEAEYWDALASWIRGGQGWDGDADRARS